MARSITFSGSFGGDPLANLERNRAEQAGKKLSKRERSEFGNRPLSDSGRRTPVQDSDGWSDARRRAETLFTGIVQEGAQSTSAARQAAESLFEMP
jgi:hypothetical protein